MSLSAMIPSSIDMDLQEWIKEDISSFDVAGAIVGETPRTAIIYGKAAPLVLAGVPFVDRLCAMNNCTVEWLVPEGTELTVEQLYKATNNRIPMGIVRGPVNRILQVERTALEVLVRASSVATMAKAAKHLAQQAGFQGRISGTRKTTPGRFRLVEKYALLVGGVDSHRYSLSSMIMLKDNHIDACGGITKTVQATKELVGFSTKIEVECREVADAFAACAAGADVVMLDNFTAHTIAAAAAQIKERYPNVVIEVSGGITLANLPDYLKHSNGGKNIDVISMGRLTQNPAAVDISMKLQKEGTAAKL
eukprot:TRINITY_DN26550_c0_g1_i1.p1 TRINITY_DN26550_c0_g1~~TRINITY_DN26550_c0_g1_i1.p1  ORF type:complete len:331 (-),score=46.71 TRINITY_DN26550_c0_g1_i1:466-1386(-)